MTPVLSKPFEFTLNDFNYLMREIRSLKAKYPAPEFLKLVKVETDEGFFWTFEDGKGNCPAGMMFSDEIKQKLEKLNNEN